MKKQVLTNKAPLPVGPYSQAVLNGNMLFVSGVLPIDIETKELIGDVSLAAQKIFEHLDAILKESGFERNNVVKSTIFMKDLGDFSKVNNIYSEYFNGVQVLPARSTIQVAGLPMNACVEMEFIVS
jgi:2-iminobutanoate/2-iminopropanoate deaminase